MSLDFMHVVTKNNGKNRPSTIEAEFDSKPSKDLMIKGSGFYAIWDEEAGLWKTDIYSAVRLIDKDLREYYERVKDSSPFNVQYLVTTSNGALDRFVKYCTKQCADNFVPLNNKVMFADSEIKKTDYASFRLPYALAKNPTPYWDELMDVLYSDERLKLEWLIGAVASGETSKIQKFFALYGAPGSGKSTVLDIIANMFDGYYTIFSAESLGSSNQVHCLEVFRNFPILAIEHDADLSRIEKNTTLNSLISHEYLPVNEKFRTTYYAQFNAIPIIGTNNPIKITDAKSGLIRRLVDIHPTGEKLSMARYREVINNIKFEYGAIAYKCLEIYKNNPHLYDNYIPTLMMGETNDTFNFFEEKWHDLKDTNRISLSYLWEEYKKYCVDANVPYPLTKKKFKVEAKEYFEEFYEKMRIDDTVCSNVYVNFRVDRFFSDREEHTAPEYSSTSLNLPDWLDLRPYTDFGSDVDNKFYIQCKDCPAQRSRIAYDNEVPCYKWDKTKSTLYKIDQTKVHFVKVPVNHIVIDFDLKDEDKQKSLELNLAAAAKFPPTYAEVSKSGNGVHLHYIYTGGDPERLSSIYDDNIEIKVFTGGSSLRRKLTLCNNLDISNINSGLPLKEEASKVINQQVVLTEKGLRTVILRNLKKEYHADTSSSIDFIAKALKDAYDSGSEYDVSDMRPAVMSFAAQASNQSLRCLKVVNQMKFKSEDKDEGDSAGVNEKLEAATVGGDSRAGNVSDKLKGGTPRELKLAFFDVEVFPNLFVIVWKEPGDDNKPIVWINPTPAQVQTLLKYDLVGFNNRSYDNHIIYARMHGYTEAELYRLSKRIISNDSHNAKFREAYNISYTDIYDFASAGNKMSLKKWEVKLGINHLELGLPWDQPVDRSLWEKVAEYCVNDVVSTEVLFYELASDYMARIILADITNMTPNTSTNTLTSQLMFGKDPTPQTEFRWRDLSKPVKEVPDDVMAFFRRRCPNMVKEPFDDQSILPYFKGYEFTNGVSMYKGFSVGEGGRVSAIHGVWYDVALLDITSMHPHSAIAECVFGPKYTERFWQLVYGRVYIKHEDWDYINDILDGKLTPYVEKVKRGEIASAALADALKTAINSVYGLTKARHKNKFKDDRNVDNIVAKRGALFMIDLEEAVAAQGYTPAHIKTDSIKIPNADMKIINFVMEYGEKYGYHFEHEATYRKMALVTNADYIAKYADEEQCMKLYGYVPDKNKKKPGKWTATGARYKEPYVFKALFTHDPIEYSDYCQTKESKTYIVMDNNEGKGDDYHNYQFVGKVGSFVPVVDGSGGCELFSVKETGKTDTGEPILSYGAVPKTKGYRWVESEALQDKDYENIIDKSYFRAMCDEGKAMIEEYMPFEEFINS